MWNRQVPSLIPMQRDARLHNERSSTQASAFLHFHLLSGSSNSHRKSTLRREIKTQDLEQEQADSELQLQLQDGATSNLRPHWSSCLCLCVLFLSCPSCLSCMFRQNQETKCSVLPQHTNTHTLTLTLQDIPSREHTLFPNLQGFQPHLTMSNKKARHLSPKGSFSSRCLSRSLSRTRH